MIKLHSTGIYKHPLIKLHSTCIHKHLVIKLHSTGIHKHLEIKLHSTGIHKHLVIKLNSTGIHKHLVIKLHSTGIHNTVSCDQFYSSTDIKVAVSRDFLAFFAQKVRPEPHMNRQKWFRKLFHFRKKYSNFKFEKFEFF